MSRSLSATLDVSKTVFLQLTVVCAYLLQTKQNQNEKMMQLKLTKCRVLN